MTAWTLSDEREFLEHRLRSHGLDMAGALVAIGQLQRFVEQNPNHVSAETVSLVDAFLGESLFPELFAVPGALPVAADALAAVTAGAADPSLAGASRAALKNRLDPTGGVCSRAAAEALGRLPLAVSGPRVAAEAWQDPPSLDWQRLPGAIGLEPESRFHRLGRSLVWPLASRSGTVLVVKMAPCRDRWSDLCREAAWMAYLCKEGGFSNVPFDRPCPVRVSGRYLFRLTGLPPVVGTADTGAIAYRVSGRYFAYPNAGDRQHRLSPENFEETLLRNAWLLGRMAGGGIVHCAPIPLFHNRIQIRRRTDGGVYQWHRGGRLDRWLESCRYPNFGVSGPRDFEHLVSICGGGELLYRHIGTHLLSLILVAGSYFRSRAPERIGVDTAGRHLDLRPLFDRALMARWVRGAFEQYHHGFAGVNFHGAMPMDIERLADRLIDAMGVDRHMTEILRAADQRQMTDDAFERLFRQQGARSDVQPLPCRGAGDLVLRTGPHLGDFNNRISIPELIDFLAVASALCVAGRHEREVAAGRSDRCGNRETEGIA